MKYLWFVKSRIDSPTVIEHPDVKRDAFRLRMMVAALFVLGLSGLLVARFLWLQAWQHNRYRTMAETNRISLVPIQPVRGDIKDRNGIVLAHSYVAYTLEVSPVSQLDDLDANIQQLNQIMEISPKELRYAKKRISESKDFESIPIKTRLTDEEVARFAANSYLFPGVMLKTRLFRQYPYGQIASHLVGYINRINEQDLADLKQSGQFSNYRGADHIGKAGIERTYEQVLHGTAGFKEIEIDSAGHPIRLLQRTPAVPGRDLVLSIDIKLQEIAEAAFGANNGALVAIDPKTGGVLSFVSMPGYDPNLFAEGIDPQHWKALNESPDRPLNDRALHGIYPPGSTFKPFMALAALEGRFRSADYIFSDPGFFWFGGHKFRDDKAAGHGSVDMYKSIVESCDTYYYSLANVMGIENIARFMSQFGFGSVTGIDLEGESSGVLPSPQWKRNYFKTPAQQKWFAGETISIGVGQGYNAYTPLQVAQATATLANNGEVFKPYLVQSVESSGIKVPIEHPLVKVISLEQKNLDLIHRAMVGVTKKGTGARAFMGTPYDVAGKTGTAQVFNLNGGKYNRHTTIKSLRDHAWFIAYAPADNPKIALAVLVENGGFGSATAAPIVRQVLDYYLLGKKPGQAKVPQVSMEPGSALKAQNSEEGREEAVD